MIKNTTGIIDNTKHTDSISINSSGLLYKLSGGTKPTITHKIVPIIPKIQTIDIPIFPPGI